MQSDLCFFPLSLLFFKQGKCKKLNILLFSLVFLSFVFPSNSKFEIVNVHQAWGYDFTDFRSDIPNFPTSSSSLRPLTVFEDYENDESHYKNINGTLEPFKNSNVGDLRRYLESRKLLFLISAIQFTASFLSHSFISGLVYNSGGVISSLLNLKHRSFLKSSMASFDELWKSYSNFIDIESKIAYRPQVPGLTNTSQENELKYFQNGLRKFLRKIYYECSLNEAYSPDNKGYTPDSRNRIILCTVASIGMSSHRGFYDGFLKFLEAYSLYLNLDSNSS